MRRLFNARGFWYSLIAVNWFCAMINLAEGDQASATICILVMLMCCFNAYINK